MTAPFTSSFIEVKKRRAEMARLSRLTHIFPPPFFLSFERYFFCLFFSLFIFHSPRPRPLHLAVASFTGRVD